MVRTLVSTCSVSCLRERSPPGPCDAQSIVGAWYFGDTRSDDSGVVVFLDSGYYFHIVNATPEDAPTVTTASSAAPTAGTRRPARSPRRRSTTATATSDYRI